MKLPWYSNFLYLFTFPWDLLVCWPVVLMVRAFWGTPLVWQNGGLWTELRPDSWPARTWYARRFKNPVTKKRQKSLNPQSAWLTKGMWETWGGTTLGNGGFYGPGRMNPYGVADPTLIDTSIEHHESEVHVEQYRSSMMRGFLYALFMFLTLHFAFHQDLWSTAAWSFPPWFFGYVMMGVPNFLTAGLYGENLYRGAVHEEHAFKSAREWERSKR